MTGADGRGWLARWPWLALAVLAAVGWTLVLGQAERSVFGLVPILDEVFYLDRAAELDGVRPPPDTSHFMSPLYPLIVRAAGAGGGVPADRVVPPEALRGLRLLQIACWCGVVVLLRAVAARVLPPGLRWRSGLVWLPSVLAAGYLPAAVYALAVMVEAPLMLLVTFALLLVLPGAQRRPVGVAAAVAAGIALGAAGLLRGTVLILVPAATACAAAGRADRRLLVALILGAAAIAVQVPAALHNSLRAGRVAGPTLNGGVNLAIGNGPEANGFYVAVVPGDWRRDPAGRAHLARELGRAEVDLATADRIWAGRAWREMRQRPLRATGLWFKKVWLHLQAWEIDQLTPLAGWRRTVPALRVFAVPWFLIVVLAVAGATDLAARRPPGWWRLPAWAGAILVAQSLFFVVSRYRLALLPVLALLAAMGAAALLRRARPAVVAAAVGVLLVVPWGLGDVQALWRAQALANEAHRRAELGVARASVAEVTRAEDLYRRSLDAGAAGSAPWLGLAALLQDDGREAAALEVLERAAVRRAADPEIRRALASALLAAGRTGAAAGHLREILVLQPDDADALHNLVVYETGHGRLDVAADLARTLISAHPTDPRGYLDLGVVQARAGDRTAAAETFRRGLAAAPGDSLLTENLRRLSGRR